MYVRDLNNGKPVIFKAVIDECPPDCGGADEDEIEYAAFCPNCDRQFAHLDQDNYCRNCGTRLYWSVRWPCFDDEV